MAERTYVMLKPDALERGIAGEIISRIEKKGFKIVDMKMIQLDLAKVEEHYAHCIGKPYYPKLRDYMLRGPVIAMIVEGDNAVLGMRLLSGPTEYSENYGGTIRGDYAKDITINVIHSSDSPESAEEEIKRFFG